MQVMQINVEGETKEVSQPQSISKETASLISNGSNLSKIEVNQQNKPHEKGNSLL